MKLMQLESLRGAMALWVFISHLLPSAGIDRGDANPFIKLLLSGGVAVDVFIMLSGFVIALTLSNQWGAGRYSYSNYIKARFFRVFPILLVTTVISAFLIDLSISVLEGLPWEIEQNTTRLEYLEASRDNFKYHFLAHLSMMHGALDFFLPYSSYSINGPAWSISLEWQFYLLAPYIVGYLMRGGLSSRVVLLLISALLSLAFIRYFYNYPAFLPNKIEFFVVGIVSYFFYSKGIATDISVRHYFVGMIVLVLVTKSLPLLIWLFIMWTILDREGALAVKVSSIVNAGVFQWFGRMSYSFYLIHMPTIYLSMYVLEEYFLTDSKLGFLIFLLVFSFSASILFSMLLYRFVERPFIALGKRINF